MKNAIKATSEKVQSLDLEGIFKNALSDNTGSHGKRTSPAAALNALTSLTSLPPPPEHTKEKSKKKKNRSSKKKKAKTPDKQYQLNLSLEELFSGKTTKRLTLCSCK